MLRSVYWIAVCLVGVLPVSSAIAGIQASTGNESHVDLYVYDKDDLDNFTLLDPRASASNQTSCGTLDLALELAEKWIVDGNASGFYIGLSSTQQIHILSRQYTFSDIKLVTMSTTGGSNFTAMVQCTYQAGLSFERVNLLHVHHMNLTGCGPLNTTQPFATGAMHLLDVLSFDMSNSHFHSSYGSSLMIQATTNATYDYNVSHCGFESNGNMADVNVVGGAVSFYLTQNINMRAQFVNTNFVGNEANVGGAVSLRESKGNGGIPCACSTLHFSSCTFEKNCAEADGGAIFLTNIGAIFEDCAFLGNTAKGTGGAIYHNLDFISDCCEPITTVYESCTWKKNQAHRSAAMFLSTDLKQPQICDRFHNSTFSRNNAIQRSIFDTSSCILFVIKRNLCFDDVTFENNQGSAIGLNGAVLRMENHVAFRFNNAYEGGALYMYTSSFITPMSNTHVDFVNNTAIYGGAIYRRHEVTTKPICIFNFGESTMTCNVSIKFVNNTAFTSGKSIYFVGPVNACEVEIHHASVSFTPDENEQVASSAKSVMFHSPVNSAHMKLDIVLGALIVFNTTITDFFSNNTTLVVNIIITPWRCRDNFCPEYELMGTHTLALESGSNNPNIFIRRRDLITSNDFSNYVLQVLGAEQTWNISLKILPCPPGFQYSSKKGTCECISFDVDMIACDLSKPMACIRKGYWFGEVENESAVAVCSFGFCKEVGQCTNCGIMGYDDYCQIPTCSDELDNQCLDNRSGTLCARCASGFSLTYGAVECVPSAGCQPVLLLTINLVFVIAWIAVAFLMLKVGCSIRSGYAFSITYYFSVITRLLSRNIHKKYVYIILSIFQGITQINTRFIGYIPVCFDEKLQPLPLYLLLYLNPLFIVIFIFVFLTISKYCRRHGRVNDNTPVQSTCILMLFSFATLTETSFAILEPVSLMSNSTHVRIQPSTPYLNVMDHVGYFVVATSVLVFLIIPFTLVLLLAPICSRWFNLTRIKPFLDEFQSPYKDKYRYMASYYFICRLFYLTVIMCHVKNPQSVQYTLELASFVILVVHALLQPYRTRVLNSLDTLVLADILAIAILNGESLCSLSTEVRLVLTEILIFLPMLMLVCIVLFAFARFICCKKNKKWLRHHSMRGKYFHRLSQQLNPTTFQDVLQDRLLAPFEGNKHMRLDSTASTSIQYRETYFKYMGFEESGEEDEQYVRRRSDIPTRVNYCSSASSMSPPSCSEVTLELLSSTEIHPEEVANTLPTTQSSSSTDHTSGCH